jgi:hypothetical protein
MATFIFSEISRVYFLETNVCLSAIFGLIFITTALLRYHLSPLKRLPGPFWARYSRVWYFIQTWKGSFHETNRLLHEEYGRINDSHFSLLFPLTP